MTKTISVYLDLLRVLAAFMVVIGHFTMPYFSYGWPNLVFWAVASVAVFFVISGYVIRYTAEEKDRDFRFYIVARISRIYSVMIPALLLSAIVACIAGHFNSQFYAEWEKFSTIPVTRILACMFFVNESYGHEATPFSDSPIWSLGYEVPFYFVFGAYHYLRGRVRIAIIIGTCLITGPNIFALFGPWLLGCYLYVWTKYRQIPRIVGALSLLGGIVVFALGVPLISSRAADIAAIVSPFEVFYRGRSGAFPVFYVVAFATGLSIIGVHGLEKEIGVVILRVRRPIEWLAARSFSLYLFHFPLFVLIYAVTAYDRNSVASQVFAFSAGVAGCLILSTVTERQKGLWRHFINELIARVERKFQLFLTPYTKPSRGVIE